MERDRLQLGAAGEVTARHYLERRSYSFLEANARTPYGELDLVMRDDRTCVFVEVKTRRGVRTGLPEEAVHDVKLRHIERAAGWYVREYQITTPWRIDVVAIDQSVAGTAELRHLIDVTAIR